MLFIGDSSVGKSSLARMCKNDTVDPSVCVTTVGFDVFKKTIVLEDGQTTSQASSSLVRVYASSYVRMKYLLCVR